MRSKRVRGTLESDPCTDRVGAIREEHLEHQPVKNLLSRTRAVGHQGDTSIIVVSARVLTSNEPRVRSSSVSSRMAASRVEVELVTHVLP